MALMACASSAALGTEAASHAPEPGVRAPTLATRAAACDLAAVSEAIAAIRQAGGDSPTLDSVRIASGKCTRFVLALTATHEVGWVCSSVEAWSATQTARELRRRIASIDSDKLLRSTNVGKACRAAYAHELRTTRVVLRTSR